MVSGLEQMLGLVIVSLIIVVIMALDHHRNNRS